MYMLMIFKGNFFLRKGKIGLFLTIFFCAHKPTWVFLTYLQCVCQFFSLLFFFCAVAPARIDLGFFIFLLFLTIGKNSSCLNTFMFSVGSCSLSNICRLTNSCWISFELYWSQFLPSVPQKMRQKLIFHCQKIIDEVFSCVSKQPVVVFFYMLLPQTMK